MLVVARLGVSGISTNLIQLASALQRVEGIECLLVHGSVEAEEGDVHDLADAAGIRRHHVPALRRAVSPIRDLKALWHMWRLIRRYRPDVVHTHASKGGLIGRLAAFLARVPVRVHTFHGHVLSGYFGRRMSQLYVLLERLAARISTRIVTLSPALVDELAGTYRVAPRHRFEVIPLGLDLQRLVGLARHAGPLRSRLGLDPAQALVGAVGRIVPVKNLSLFVQAAAIVHASSPTARFALVGDGELRDRIAGEVRDAGLEDVVVMVGWEKDVAGVMSDLDLVAITSDNEGTPVSLLEAITAGVPVVATDVGGVRDVLAPELLEQVVAPNDPDAFARAILRTLDDPPDLHAARERLLSIHDIDACAATHIALYEGLLAGDAGAGG